MKDFNVKERLNQRTLQFLEDLLSNTTGYDIYLGGGYLRDSYWNNIQGYSLDYGFKFGVDNNLQPKQPKDLDIFLIPNNEPVKQLPLMQNCYVNYNILAADIENCRDNVERVIGLFARMLTPTKDIQLIVYDKYLTIEELAVDMDCNINQIMYSVKNDNLFMSTDFIKSHEEKTIKMMHDFEQERMFNRLRRMQKKYPDYTLVHNIPQEDFDYLVFLETYKPRKHRADGSFIND